MDTSLEGLLNKIFELESCLTKLTGRCKKYVDATCSKNEEIEAICERRKNLANDLIVLRKQFFVTETELKFTIEQSDYIQIKLKNQLASNAQNMIRLKEQNAINLELAVEFDEMYKNMIATYDIDLKTALANLKNKMAKDNLNEIMNMEKEIQIIDQANKNRDEYQLKLDEIENLKKMKTNFENELEILRAKKVDLALIKEESEETRAEEELKFYNHLKDLIKESNMLKEKVNKSDIEKLKQRYLYLLSLADD